MSVVTADKSKSNLDFLNKDISLFGSSFGDKKKEQFYSELSILFTSGIDIRTALDLIADEQAKAKDKLLFIGLRDAIVSGSGLSAAMEGSGKFTDYEIFSIRIGEESGRLTEVLKELSLFFSKKIKQKRQVTSALSYPAIVFVASFGAIFFMMKFVVPMFADVFKRFKGDLPSFTKLIVRTSDFFSDYALLIIGIMISVIILLYNQRRSEWLRKYGSALVLRIPVIRDMVAKIYLGRFCQSMSLLIGARTPLVTAIDLVKRMVDFYPIETSLEQVKKDVLQGVPLNVSLAKFKIYNKRLTALIKVAEEVNQMDTMFDRLANQFSEEVEHQTTLLGNVIEPMMIIFLGALVAIILVAMYLPMFQMGNAVG